jgi:hypothetical protein
MWHRCKNLIHSLKTYDALSPDLKLRRRVNRVLHQRPAMQLEQWFRTFYQPEGIAFSVANFAYIQLPIYSGLEFSHVLPSDRLNEDLHWTQVCWFDWQISLCDDFHQQFGVEISDDLDEATLFTVQDLIRFLNQAIARA